MSENNPIYNLDLDTETDAQLNDTETNSEVQSDILFPDPSKKSPSSYFKEGTTPVSIHIDPGTTGLSLLNKAVLRNPSVNSKSSLNPDSSPIYTGNRAHVLHSDIRGSPSKSDLQSRDRAADENTRDIDISIGVSKSPSNDHSYALIQAPKAIANLTHGGSAVMLYKSPTPNLLTTKCSSPQSTSNENSDKSIHNSLSWNIIENYSKHSESTPTISTAMLLNRDFTSNNPRISPRDKCAPNQMIIPSTNSSSNPLIANQVNYPSDIDRAFRDLQEVHTSPKLENDYSSGSQSSSYNSFVPLKLRIPERSKSRPTSLTRANTMRKTLNSLSTEFNVFLNDVLVTPVMGPYHTSQPGSPQSGIFQNNLEQTDILKLSTNLSNSNIKHERLVNGFSSSESDFEALESDTHFDMEKNHYRRQTPAMSLYSDNSLSYKRSDIYSTWKIIGIIALALFIPPLFFVFAFYEQLGFDERQLLEAILRSDHKKMQIRDYYWDLDISWFKRLCFGIGICELFLAIAGIAIGFGVGLTR